jgi:hypothetical protein
VCYEYETCFDGLLYPANCCYANCDANIGTCGESEITTGCTDPEACNYDETATADDGSCEYEYDCAGTCGGDLEPDRCMWWR